MPERGYPGSGDGATMPPSPPDPSGSPPPETDMTLGDLKARVAQAEPVHPVWGEPFPATEWRKAQLREARTTLDPVRAAALQAAVAWLPTRWAADGTLDLDQVLQAADEFAAWLIGGDQAEQLPIDPHPFVDQHWSTGSPSDSCHLATSPDRICGRRRDDPVHQGEMP